MKLVPTWEQRNHEKLQNLKVHVLWKPSLRYVTAYVIDILHNHSFNLIYKHVSLRESYTDAGKK